MRKYKFYEDPGHGWLEVPRVDIAEVGQEGSVSNFSYQLDDNVYLEEDCDMSFFLRALEVAEIKYEIENIPQEDSPIREYERYRMSVIL